MKVFFCVHLKIFLHFEFTNWIKTTVQYKIIDCKLLVVNIKYIWSLLQFIQTYADVRVF